jgi:prevent-host-death family protein
MENVQFVRLVQIGIGAERMTRLAAAKVREEFSEVVNKVAYGRDRVVVTRNDKDLVAVVSLEDLAALERMEAEIDKKLVISARAEVKKRGTIPWEEVKSKAAKKQRRRK